MNEAFSIAGIGLAAQQRALDTIAGNMANINTQGFKRSDVQFSALMARAPEALALVSGAERNPIAAGVQAQSVPALGVQGELEQTGHALDVAIVGPGFIELMGRDGEVMLWRGGRLSIREDGLLAGPQGLALRANLSIPIDGTALRIDTDGVVSVQTSDDGARNELGRIDLAQVDDLSTMERLDGGLYSLTDRAQVRGVTPAQDGAGRLAQGTLERSNVDINSEMVQLMIVQRAYAANAQIVQAADQLAAIANGLRR